MFSLVNNFVPKYAAFSMKIPFHEFQSKTAKYWPHIQGVQDQNFQIKTAITQKLCTWDPKMVKPKCVWKIYIFSQLIEPFPYNKYNNMKNEYDFQSCLHGIVDKRLDW